MAKKKEGTEKFEKLYQSLAKELAGEIPNSYTHRGTTYKISGKAKGVAADYFAEVFAGEEQVEHNKRKLMVAKDATDAKGLVEYFRKVSKELGSGTDYSKSSDVEVLNHIKRTLNDSPYRAGKLVDNFLESGDPTVMELLPDVLAGEMKEQFKTKAEIKMLDAFRDKDGQVNPEYKKEVSTALAAMKMKAGFGTIKESPYLHVNAPGDGLEGMVKGMRTDRGGGMYHNTSWADRAVNQYAN
jgi:hypothetical protein